MAITFISLSKSYPKDAKTETGVTTGNEFIYSVGDYNKFVLEAHPTVAGEAMAYFTSSPDKPTDFDDMVPQDSTNFTSAFSVKEADALITYVGVKVISGTWTVTTAVKG